MGKVQALQYTWKFVSDLNRIKGFDFANWLKNNVSKRDFIVVKTDVEGAEFELIPRLVETGAICLIDEMFLECHYNRWQRCCPGMRSFKYRKTYSQCLDLFSSLREKGILVHQWWWVVIIKKGILVYQWWWVVIINQLFMLIFCKSFLIDVFCCYMITRCISNVYMPFSLKCWEVLLYKRYTCMKCFIGFVSSVILVIIVYQMLINVCIFSAWFTHLHILDD